MLFSIFLILLVVLMGASGQFLLKSGVNQIGKISLLPLDFNNLILILIKLITNPLIILGLAVFGLSAFLWIVVLSREDLTFAYPFWAIQFVLVLTIGWLLLGESLTFGKILSSIFIITGLLILIWFSK